MKFVKADWDADLQGFHVDPQSYLAELPKLREELPPGAWEFASDPGHYSMSSTHCVKDLELSDIHLATDKSGRLTLEFAPNEWKHDTGLTITYSGVRHFSIDYQQEIDWMPADAILLDEILPDQDGGCIHEMALTDASITVRSNDLRAVWG
ncbi:hypothetical protein GCM10018793_05630 [Streptomyces sulfonofaciens]|uniref:Uncharacterized protein n=1 Tax=Streptomyces sulfonofaciens TaxID=68272 RepID=A0A919FR18_9ACTN|nr:hypothetical protein [Streptomyces sulfonofaciens]GHH70877.1 hypothetical protein GCM10018793_05630 [Streptomyces sulfonofaciens]